MFQLKEKPRSTTTRARHVPFFLVGAFAVNLPKGGSWIVARRVKWFFGVMRSAVLALYFLRNGVPDPRAR